MLPLHSNTLEPQESLACQGKQKCSLHTHNFLKIVSSNLASGLVFLLLFVFSYPLCSALSWGAAAPQSCLLFQDCSAVSYGQPPSVVTGTTCKGDLAPPGHLKCSHRDLWQTVSGSSLEVTWSVTVRTLSLGVISGMRLTSNGVCPTELQIPF